MRSKRLLAMLLALCLVVTALSPAALAVSPGEDAYMAGQVAEEAVAADESEASASGKLVASEQSAIKTMRGEAVKEAGYEPVVKTNGTWSADETSIIPSVSLKGNELNKCLEELKVAAELYGKDDVVSAFVVMEEAPLAEFYTSRSMVSASLQAGLIEKQDNVINAIEKSVLGGRELDVRYQFTYLTNSFTVKTEFGNLEAIAKMPGVKSVFLTPVYEPASTTADPNTAASGAMTGVADVWADLGYTGTGMKIAIIDTGLDLDHPSFAADPETNENSLTAADIAGVLGLLNAYEVRSSITASSLYRSAKVPFAFNYVDANLTADHSSDQQGDHGTHVAGIAAANAVEGTTVVGMAPDAQLVIMKVFGAGGGAYMDDIVAALEDAMTMGCDVVNASLGSPAGFSDSGVAEMDVIYERIAAQDIVVCFSAGNEGTSSYGNMWGTDLNRTQNPDNATIGSPSTYANVMSIASAENSEVMTDYFSIAADEEPVFFVDSLEAIYASAGYEGYYGVSMKTLAGLEYEYVIIDGLGYAENYYDAEGNSLVEGKIAVVKRGELNFSTKIFNAQYAGAVAVIVWNNNDTDDVFTFGMSTSDAETGETPYIPSAMVTLADGQRMADAEVKAMVVAEGQAARPCEGGQMSSFSSWGVSPDLRLVPDITGIGGNVYSCYDGGQYGLMSGTSMSSPQLAGISALVMQHLYTVYPDAPDGSIRALAEAILMSTADPVVSDTSGVEASPRQQGAGLVNALEATTTTTYLTVGGGRPKAELGDGSTGEYTFSFEIHNFGDEDKSYTMGASLLTEGVVGYWVSDTEAEFFMAGDDMPLSGSVSFDQDVVVVPAGGMAYVTATVSLSDYDKAVFDYYFENGGYVEGFVYLFNEEGASELNLPFLGFYGDWTEAPVFDTANWYDNSFWGAVPAGGIPEGDQYYNVFWTTIGGSDWVLGFNPYAGAVADQNGNIYYDPAYNVLSPNGDGFLDGLDEIYLSLLRNASTLTFTYSVGDVVVHRETIEDARKTMYQSAYGQIVPWMYSWYGYDMYDFAGLPSGTEVLLTVEATVDYGTGGEHKMEIPIVIDTTAPELLAVGELPQDDGTQILGVQVADDYALASVVLMNPSGTRIYDQVYDVYGLYPAGDGSYIAYFDVTGLGSEFTVAVCDYGCNEAYYTVTYTADESGNLPEMDTDKLYAYRVMDYAIYSDHMYGWVSMSKPASAEDTSNIVALTDDYLEYAAINAAEYVDGKIFAVDAVYNLVVMDPGLFDRNTVTNLGINVLDMTFDDSTDTMYVLGRDGYYSSLYSMDLLTGELTELASFGYYYYGPWAIADDDNGTLYAIKNQDSGIYTMSAEDGFTVTEVVDGEGNPIVITNSYGEPVSPNYAQSITWADGTLYWAYFMDSYAGVASELISINTEDWTVMSNPYKTWAYDASNQVVEYSPYTELVGLLTLTETDYEIPEADEVVSIALNAEQIIMAPGESNSSLRVSWLPWNFNMDQSQLVWTSSDESVASVAGGVVTGVSEGTAVITVAYGDLTASCEIIVVDTSGEFYTYNYYSADGYYGYMINVDMATMDYYLVGGPSPVDFMAGAYNGHDGYFYGYDIGGQLYRYDIESGEAVALGTSLGTYPVDMAYDYSTGMMYALTLDYNTYQNTLYAINMNNGKAMSVATGSGLMTLACSTDGVLYGMDAYGNLCELAIVDYSDYGMGCMLEPVAYVMEESFGELYLLASMCWDHNNDVLLWNWCESATMMWLDVGDRHVMEDDLGSYVYYENSYYVDLGDPTESGVCEFTGMFVIPDEIPELAPVAVESVTAEDMMIFTGYEKIPAVTVAPFNATCQNVVLTSGDPAVVEVTENGTLLGVSVGTAVVTATLYDEVGNADFETSFNVVVKEGADNMFAHLLTDVSSYNGQAWIQMNPGNPGVYNVLNYFDYTIFTQEYVDGKIYTYGYDAMDWTGNQQFFILDAETYAVETQIDMGEAFPFVYDMTYDYVTATMYVLAGVGEDDTQLYMADMETGELILVMDPEPLMLALAAGPEGKLYAIENTVSVQDEWDPWATPTYTNAMLHVIDPLEGTMELVGDTGLTSNMISSMAYDYDSDAMYWTAFAQTSGYISHLAIVDLETGVASSLGTIGVAGAQVGGLYFVCDEYPETDSSTLHSVVMTSSKETVSVGETVELDVLTIPGDVKATVKWISSDRNVATVDANGVVTGVAQGKATITAIVQYSGVTKRASCDVAVLNSDAAFLAYNATDGGWATISRSDYTVTANLTEGEEIGVAAITSIGADVYGYDVNGQLFKLDTETFERVNIGEGLGLAVEEGYKAVVKDMTYDAASGQVIVLIDTLMWDDWFGEYSEIYGGCAIYTLDLETGALEQMYVFENHSYVYALSADGNGNLFFYNTFDDEVSKYNTETGEISKVVSLQTQSLYGDMYCEYSMHYDDLSGVIYLLFTSNGTFNKMVTIDAATGELTDAGNVGDVVYNNDTWSYDADVFVAMTFVYVESGLPADPSPEPIVIPSNPIIPSTPSEPEQPEQPEEPEQPEVVNPFVDVAVEDYFYNAVLWAVENGITTGADETSFAPAENCTRGQVVTFLWRAAGSPVVEAENPFADVVEGDYYYDAVLWAVENGITTGVGADTFAPGATCTRGQVVTFLWRAAGSPVVEVENPFTDVAEDDYFYNAVLWAVESGITNGVGSDTFAPAEICTRGQVVTFLSRNEEE